MSPRIVPDCSPEIDPANYPGPICTPHLSVLRNATPPGAVKLLSSNCWLPIVFIADDFFFCPLTPFDDSFFRQFPHSVRIFQHIFTTVGMSSWEFRETGVHKKSKLSAPRNLKYWQASLSRMKKSANFPSPIWAFFGWDFCAGLERKKTDKTSHKAITKLANLFSFE